MNGVNVIGYLNDSMGLGESARFIVASLEAHSIPVCKISIDSKSAVPGKLPHLPYAINLFCMDYHHTTTFLESLGWQKMQKFYNIANIFWETNLLPKERRVHWEYVDEIWVTSRYIQEHVSFASSIPVYRINQPVQFNLPENTPSLSKELFAIDSRYTFLFCFDFGSIFNRKNPLGVIEAFSKAFPQADDVQLVLKSHQGGLYPDFAESLRKEVQKDSRIRWIDEMLSREKRYELMNGCDCYISLHRSEGLGLTMAEAMLLSKPVIATGYSGNLDFMHEDNSFLCPYTLVPIGPGNEPYPKKGFWAEVDLDQAAYWMKYVKEHSVEANLKAKRGKEYLLKYHSFSYVGNQIAKRIKAINCKHKTPKKVPFVYIKRKMMLSAPSPLRHALARLKRKLMLSNNK